MIHAWSVLCLYTSRGIESNNPSLIECIDQINYRVKPGTPEDERVNIQFRFYLVTSWRRSTLGVAENGTGRVTVKSPIGKLSPIGTYEIDLVGIEETMRSVITFENVGVVQDGIYEFIVDYQPIDNSDWIQVAAVPLQFKREFQVTEESQPSG